MRVFVYEFVTGGGWYAYAREALCAALAREGTAMLTALACDLASIDNCQVDVLADTRLGTLQLSGVKVHPVDSAESESRAIAALSATADWTVLIAPEFDGQLQARTLQVEHGGGRLLSPSSQVVALAADKHAMAQRLTQHQIAAPHGIVLEPGAMLPADFPYPAVLKPREGAGSLGVEWIGAWTSDGRLLEKGGRLEVYCPGTAASVACLCGPGGVVPLVPCQQKLAGARDFSYQGGSLPLEPRLADRARDLASRAVSSLPCPVGYVGVDLVLGNDPSGRGDFVIEINPRLTTSYVGLRAFSRVNLAAVMIAVADGGDATLCWKSGRIDFTSAGKTRLTPVRDNE